MNSSQKAKRKVQKIFFEVKMQQDEMMKKMKKKMKLQVKPQKRAEITYLESTKEQTRYRLTYLDGAK